MAHILIGSITSDKFVGKGCRKVLAVLVHRGLVEAKIVGTCGYQNSKDVLWMMGKKGNALLTATENPEMLTSCVYEVL